jgi:hypothetical protein
VLASDGPLLRSENMLDWVECDHLLKEVEPVVAVGRMREERDGGVSRPGDDGNEEYTSNDGALYPIHHEQSREDPAADDPEPEGWIPHLASDAESIGILKFRDTAGELQRLIDATGNCTNARIISQADDGEVQTDPCTAGNLQARRDGPGKPLPESENRQGNEYEALDKYCTQSHAVGYRSLAVITHNLIGEVRVKAHARCQGNRHVRKESHAEAGYS